MLPCGSDGKESACNAGDLCSIPGLGRSPGEGNGNTLQYSCLGNPMDRGAWWASVHGVAQSQTRLKRLSSSSSMDTRSLHKLSEVKVAKSCPTLCNPVDCCLPGFLVHGDSPGNILEWVAIPFSRGSSQPRNGTQIFCIAGRFFSF